MVTATPAYDLAGQLRRAAVAEDYSWCNAIYAFPESGFVIDVAAAVSNDGEIDAGKRWLLALTGDFLRCRGRNDGAWAAYDFAIDDFEAIGRAWPAMHLMATMMPDARTAQAALPTLARFLAERLPAIWSRQPWRPKPAVGRAVTIVDRTHDLVGLFSVGIKPNGSKDPFALRRAANHWLMQVVLPMTLGPVP